MKLIENWQSLVLRLNSTQWMGVWSAIVTTWLLTPEEDKATLLGLIPFGVGDRMPAFVVLAAFIGGIYMRLRAQPELHMPKEEPME